MSIENRSVRMLCVSLLLDGGRDAIFNVTTAVQWCLDVLFPTLLDQHERVRKVLRGLGESTAASSLLLTTLLMLSRETLISQRLPR